MTKEVSTEVSARPHSRYRMLLWLAPLVWGAFLATLWRGFTFFWDEWNVLSASLSQPFASILQENGGNFFPLSRLVFVLETQIFRENYWAYIFVTSSIFGYVALLFATKILRPQTRPEIVFAALLAFTYLITAGVLFASAMGFMVKWALAPLLAVLTVMVYERIPHRWWRFVGAAGVLVLTGLAFSSAVVIMGAFIAGAILRNTSSWRAARPIVIDAAALFAVSGLLGVAGAFAARSFPANDVSVTGDPFSTLDLSNPFNAVSETWAATVSGVTSSISVLPLTDLNLWVTLVYLVAGNTLVFGFLTLLVAALLWFSQSRFALLAGIAALTVSFGFLVVLKDPIIVRYQALWVLPAMVVVWIIFTRTRGHRLLTGARVALMVWMIGAVAVSLTWIPRAGSLERDRYVVDTSRLYAEQTCLDEATIHSEEISPSASPEYVCEVVGRLVGWGQDPESR